MRKTDKGLLFPEVTESFVKVEGLIVYLTNFLGGCSHKMCFKMEVHLSF